MKNLTFLFILLFSCMMPALNAQDLSAHQWKDRLLLLLTSDVTQTEFLNQLTELQAHQEGLQERKLLVYKITPERYQKGLTSDQSSWLPAPILYHDFQPADTPFSIVLIGLDGGIKLRENQLVGAETIFALIDSMPMRRAEMKRRQD